MIIDNLKSLLKTEDHVLRDYIYAIDDYLDDDTTLRSIAQRIGIYIPDDENALYILLDRLNDYLLNEKDPEVTRKIVNATFDEYENSEIFFDRLRN